MCSAIIEGQDISISSVHPKKNPGAKRRKKQKEGSYQTLTEMQVRLEQVQDIELLRDRNQASKLYEGISKQKKEFNSFFTSDL